MGAFRATNLHFLMQWNYNSVHISGSTAILYEVLLIDLLLLLCEQNIFKHQGVCYQSKNAVFGKI
jgi:hypothetical protein